MPAKIHLNTMLPQENDLFILQKYKEARDSVMKALWTTIKSVMDSKQPPYRILLRNHAQSEKPHMISVRNGVGVLKGTLTGRRCHGGA